jgi:flagellar hook protein FlgE
VSLETALTGLLGSQTGLDTVSNDLANASTTGFKSQTALFSAIYAANSHNTPGIGVQTKNLDTNFSQGDLIATGNPLDAAIQGDGFFVVSANGQQQYTRDGSFQLSSTGVLETSSGAAVLGYAENANGTASGALQSLTVNTGAVPAQATSQLGLTLNLNSSDPVIPAGTAFNAADPATYDETTSVTTYDSLGNANTTQLYLVQNPVVQGSGDASSWTVYAQPVTASGADAGAVQTLGTLGFNTNGQLISGSPATLNVDWGNGAAASSIAFDFTGTTLGAQPFAIAGTTNNGYAPGNYEGTTITPGGQVQSTYSNGQTINAGTLGIANFINQQGLQAESGNLYAQSTTSGTPVINAPGTGQAGTVSAGNLEASNASTSALLVQLIQYQQAYQANATVIQTEQSDSTRLTQI